MDAGDLDEEVEQFAQAKEEADSGGKDRSSSNESTAKALLVNLFDAARTRLSSMEIVNGLMPGTAAVASDSPSPQVLGKHGLYAFACVSLTHRQ